MRPGDGVRDRILVAVNHRPHSERLIRRGWRLADRLQGQLWVLVVLETGSSRSWDEERDLDRLRALAAELGARFVTRPSFGQHVGQTIAVTAEELGVTQLVLGQPLRKPGWPPRLKPSPIDYVLGHVDFADLYVVAHTRP